MDFLTSEVSALCSEGFLKALVGDFASLPCYWRGMLKDFPNHPVRDKDPDLTRSVGCTLY